MVRKFLVLLCLFFLYASCERGWLITHLDPIYTGCPDLNACNYSIENTHDDGSCWSPTEGCTCTNAEDTVADCAGVCGGSAIEDACGTCGGDITVANECDCDGEEVMDCAGVCGGTAIDDECGVCGGNNSSCVNFSTEIQPIFTANCSGCHIASTRNNLSLSNYSSITSGNSSNGPVIIAGDHTNSLLWQYVNSGAMPPGNSNLTASQINLIATWIDEGALDN